jgi:peptidyl-prolyl cis-trans isomerase C
LILPQTSCQPALQRIHSAESVLAHKEVSMQFRLFKAALAASLFALTVGFSQAVAQEDKVLATIGGVPIMESEVKSAESGLDASIARLPEDQRRVAAIGALIDIKSLATKARAAKIEESAEFKQQMALFADRQLHDLYFKQQVIDKITDADVRARYDKEVAATPPQNEIRARHILVKTEDEAKAIIKELDGGAKFEDVAKAKSTDGAAAEGGDLGYFGPGQMVPEFEKVAFTT